MTDVPPPPPPGEGWQGPPPPPPPPPGWAAPGIPSAAAGPVDAFGRPLAAWWKRLVALLVDGVVVAVPTALLVGIIGFGALDTGGSATFAAGGLGTLFGLAYYALLDGSDRGQTLGKMALAIQVRDERTGGPIGYGKGVLRHVLQTVVGFLSCLGFVFVLVDGLFPLWDPKRQTLHDKVAGSVVIDAPRSR